ncbi:DUF4270 domain-containing protein [Chitinophaga horti]|uniref:DUF4270 domain-containing protein n=1 Tax=Chitinophaga horti TaxID=2920382 RepID=A0ABY6J6M4_9BACT|nr:DUF4270 domain-containing protein [Chitinophaga horti]UYQ95247.1 DUF4270 domain-containing protein [Chitinophaga horti]
MKINIRNFSGALALMAALFAYTACNKATSLGVDLIPGSDNVNVKDTTIENIIANNIWQTDSAVFTGAANYTAVLGSITDDLVFGRTQGTLYTQVSLPNSGFSYSGTAQTLDSVILYIGYNGFYGDSMAPLKLNVYRMNEPKFRIDSNYRYYQKLGVDVAQQIGSATIIPRQLRDSIIVYGVKQTPALRIALTPAFGNLLLQQTTSGNFVNDSTFRAFLGGIAVVPDTTVLGRNLLYLNLASTSTKLSVYYKSAENDSLVSSFAFDSYASAHANYFSRNYTGSEAAQYINTNNPLGDSLLFLQEAPGIYAKLKIPGLESIPKAIINKAELAITEVTFGSDPARDAIYTEPDRLMLAQYQAATGDSVKALVDYGNPTNPNLSYFGGQRTVISDLGIMKVVQYKFNIARHLQLLLDSKDTNFGLRLEALSSLNIDSRRVKVGGGNHSTYKMKLRIIYTQL